MPKNFWIEEYLRPNFVSDEAWQKVQDHLLSEISDPLEDASDYLAETVARLEGMGFTNVTPLAALKFQVEQSLDLGSLQERTNLGSMGQGWSSLADVKLQINEAGAKTISGLVSIDAFYSLNASSSAQYIASISLGKIVSQDGGMTNDGVMLRPVWSLISSKVASGVASLMACSIRLSVSSLKTLNSLMASVILRPASSLYKALWSDRISRSLSVPLS